MAVAWSDDAVEELQKPHFGLFREGLDDPTLRDVENSQAETDARLIANLMQELLPAADPKEIEEVAAFAIVMVASSVLYLHTTPRKVSRGLLRELKRHLELRIEALIAETAT